MNSIEKYEELVHEYGSWENYMNSLKKMEHIDTTPIKELSIGEIFKIGDQRYIISSDHNGLNLHLVKLK